MQLLCLASLHIHFGYLLNISLSHQILYTFSKFIHQWTIFFVLDVRSAESRYVFINANISRNVYSQILVLFCYIYWKFYYTTFIFNIIILAVSIGHINCNDINLLRVISSICDCISVPIYRQYIDVYVQIGDYTSLFLHQLQQFRIGILLQVSTELWFNVYIC